jgi:diguanylate cyclase (GGDEF)-like protein
MIPVIFLTGSERRDDKIRGLDLGAVDYVTKPFDPFELLARVRAALRTKHLQDLLVQHSQIDPLTELANRRALTERLKQEWARTRRAQGRLAFIMGDVDHFKRVNDTHGHHVGDRVLRHVAGAVAESCRTSDLPARYGGEEFAVVVPDQSVEGAERLAERCRREVELVSVDAEGEAVRVTASFGVADAADAGSPEHLIRLADEALYRAKEAGRNRVERHAARPAA